MKPERKLYGFSQIYNFPCFCWGTKVYVFKIEWSKVNKRFYIYSWVDSADTVLDGIDNGHPKYHFFGYMTICGYWVEFNKKLYFEEENN